MTEIEINLYIIWRYRPQLFLCRCSRFCALYFSFSTVGKRIQHCCSQMRTKEMLRDIQDGVLWTEAFIEHHQKHLTLCVSDTSQHNARWWPIDMLDPFGGALRRKVSKIYANQSFNDSIVFEHAHEISNMRTSGR